MVYIALILSFILLLVANLAAWRANRRIHSLVYASLVVTFLPCGMMIILPAVWLQALVLLAAFIIWRLARWRARSFLALSLGATVMVYGLIGWFIFLDLQSLRDRFPYVSLKERLPMVTQEPVSLSPDAGTHLAQLEEQIETMAHSHGPIVWRSRHQEQREDQTKLEETIEDGELTDQNYAWRSDALRLLHEETVEVFVNQAGFGYSRMPGMAQLLKRGLREEQFLPQPGPPSTAKWSTGALALRPLPPGESAEHEKNLGSLHQTSVFDFIHPAGFGYVKDRGHVAGFQEHQFSKVPKGSDRWILERLELVGLVVHEEPVVYVSDHLPRMDELRKAPTRAPDPFETAGLRFLRRGNDPFVRGSQNARRMLGAIRSAKQCLDCHGGHRGDLLGAFSYTLVNETQRH